MVPPRNAPYLRSIRALWNSLLLPKSRDSNFCASVKGLVSFKPLDSDHDCSPLGFRHYLSFMGQTLSVTRLAPGMRDAKSCLAND